MSNILYTLLALNIALACPSKASSGETTNSVEKIRVVGDRSEILRQPGSVDEIDAEILKKFDHTDIERILTRVPGVTLQGEDGYGLRPNIGMRGVHPHRSRKITLMEDNVLVAPAPYSAPAAYYFPSTERINSIEIYKGTTATIYGPQNLGGALNLNTRSPSGSTSSDVRLRTGSHNERKLAASLDGSSHNIGFLAVIDQLSSDGFKTLPSGDDTGFSKRGIMTKATYDFVNSLGEHELTLKVDGATETSHETYLGLTKQDFKEDPYQRYAASSLDKMEWKRTGVLMSHRLEHRSGFISDFRVYQHKFSRKWAKFNGFGDTKIKPRDLILQEAPENHNLQILKGNQDSVSSSGSDYIVLGTNDRNYVSKGAQWQGTVPISESNSQTQVIKLGIRQHYDEIKRHHYTDRFRMQAGRPTAQSSADTKNTVVRNHDSVNATTFTLGYEYESDFVSILPALRNEVLELCRDDKILAEKTCFQKSYASYGLGLNVFVQKYYQVFFGINQSIGAPSPGDDSRENLEEAINYEHGLRYVYGTRRAEIIGFYSDYLNIKGTCSQSSGCDLASIDKTFSGGKAAVYGVEALGAESFHLSGWRIPVMTSYTYTFASFRESLESDNPEWGIGTIQPKDPLPYIPIHKVYASIGANKPSYGFTLSQSFTGQRFDQSVVSGRRVLDPYGVSDAIVWFMPISNTKIDLKVDNLTDERYVTSIRPYGYRPGKPRTISAGITSRF